MSIREPPPPIVVEKRPPGKKVPPPLQFSGKSIEFTGVSIEPSRQIDLQRFAVPIALVLILVIGVAIGLLQATARSGRVPHRVVFLGAGPGRLDATPLGLIAPLAAQLGSAARQPAPGGAAGAASTRFPPVAIALHFGWRILRDRQNAGLLDSWGSGGAPTSGWRPVSMPDDFNADLTRAGDRGQVWWYETTFTAPRA
jgi:hypothetical protein